jgi:hypothetical protein
MQHKERRETNEMAIQIVLLAVFEMLRPTQSCLCFWCPPLSITVSACLAARQEPSPMTLPARTTFRATHVRDNPHSMLCETRSVRVWQRP